MKKKSANLYFIQYLQDSLVWILPVGLVIFTFLILFFSISEQVAYIKSSNGYLLAEVTRLNDKFAMSEGKLSNTDTPINNTKATTYLGTNNTIKKVAVDYQRLSVSEKPYWVYSFQPKLEEKKPDTKTEYILDKEGIKAMVTAYTLKDDTKSPLVFDMFEYESANKQIKNEKGVFDQIIVIYNGKVLIFNDFKSNDTKKLKDTLSLLSKTDNVPTEIKNSATEELQKI